MRQHLWTGVVAHVFKKGDWRMYSNFSKLLLFSLPEKCSVVKEEPCDFHQWDCGPDLHPCRFAEGVIRV